MMYGKIGVTFLKTTLTFVLIFSMFKLIIGWYYGYKNINGVYGGSYFYNWRVNHVDPKISKTFYKPIGLNEQDLKNKILYKYLDHVQGTERKFMTESYDFAEKKYKTVKDNDNNNLKRKKMPYYIYGFTDTFVYSPNKNWMLFNNDEKKLNMELKYLDLRGDFINKLYYEDRGVILSDKYFSDKENEKLSLSKGNFFTELEQEKVVSFFRENTNFIDVKKLAKIINNIIVNKNSYKITMTSDSAEMQSALKVDVMVLVDYIFNNKKEDFKISEDCVNGFFYRVAVIKMRPMDAHILNRIYSLCAILFTGISDNSIDVPEYKDCIKKIKECENSKDTADKDRIKRKINILNKKKNSLRAEIMFVKISQLFASLYHKGNFIMQPKDDKRPFLEKYGSPKLAMQDDFKKDAVLWKKNKDLLNEEIKSLMKKLMDQ